MKQPAVAGWLQRLCAQKKIVRTGYGQYQLVEKLPESEALVGIPVADGVPDQLMYEAEVALLGAVKCLTRLADHSKRPSLRNFALGALAAQNRQIDVIRLARSAANRSPSCGTNRTGDDRGGKT